MLAGRDELLQSWRLILNDIEVRGRVGARDTILAGPRGIGKTATLLAFGDVCRAHGYEIVNLQAAARNAGLIDSLVNEARRRIEAGAGPWKRTKRAFEQIAALNLTVAGFGAGLTARPHDLGPRSVSPGDLASALTRLAQEVRADAPHGGVLVTVDEMQVAADADLALLAAALQRLNADEPEARVLFAGTGLPHMPEVLRAAGVTHPDRLFHIRQIPLTLDERDALFAIIAPARKAGVSWDSQAARLIVHASNAHPAHLQLFADHAWTAASADSGTITVTDSQRALGTAGAEIEERTLEPRLERLTDRQIELLTALAVNGGRATSAQVTATLGLAAPKAFSRLRDELIAEGDIYAPRRGEMALTVPLLGPYLVAHYEDVRGHAGISLLAVEEMQRNVTALIPQRIGGRGQPG